ncbi:uncharacterized protein LOC135400975 [Ornithodoros turicata]|uniref:uncharacterized protein LOC135400975 n=1 Tax=Ornithodoros turicata TaxID=34597 RepID=UPI003138CEC9
MTRIHLGILIFSLLASVNGSSTAHNNTEGSDTEEAARMLGPFLPWSLSLFPYAAPVISKTIFLTLASGVAYLALFAGSFFFPSLGSLLGIRPFTFRSFSDIKAEHVNRVARAVQEAIETTTAAVEDNASTNCRRRLVCEMSKAISDGVPAVPFVDNLFRNSSEDTNTYLGAWASGWLGNDCSVFHKNCDLATSEGFASVVSFFGGPNSYVGSLLTRFSNGSRDPGTSTMYWVTSTLAKVVTSTLPSGSTPPPAVLEAIATTLARNVIESTSPYTEPHPLDKPV